MIKGNAADLSNGVTPRPLQVDVDSYASTKARFDTADAAARYSRKHDNARDRREQRCVAAAINACRLAAASYVLDLPCGAGRLSPMIVEMGHRLVAADCSQHMVNQAANAWARLVGQSHPSRNRVAFEVRDVMNTGYENSTFDLVICNRLLHHFSESQTRISAMAELARVSRRWVIVSFFNANTLDARRRKCWQTLTGQKPRTRLPIPFQQFESNVNRAGLRIVQNFPSRGTISPQWYVLLEKN